MSKVTTSSLVTADLMSTTVCYVKFYNLLVHWEVAPDKTTSQLPAKSNIFLVGGGD